VKSPLILVTALLLLASSCGGGSDTPAPEDTPTATTSPRPNPTIISATETPAATGTSTGSTTPEPTPSPSVTTTPTATAQPTATGSPNPSVATDVEGFPFGTADVRAAVEERGFGFVPVGDRAPICPASSVTGRAFWSANLAGSDSGPLLVLWVYEDPSALKLDWEVEPGSAPSPRFDCELPSGFVYWNENMVLALETWLAGGSDVPIGDERPSDHPAVQAFLLLAR